MKINIEIIDHADQRYSTCGDWFLDDEGTLQIRISRMRDSRFEALAAIHEILEVLTEGVRRTGRLEVPREFVKECDKFDMAYEASRKEDDATSEPGYDPKAPYHQGHMAASAIEHIAAMLIYVNYNEYEKAIYELP